MHSLVIGPFSNLWPVCGSAILIDDYCIIHDKSLTELEVSYKVATSQYRNQRHNDDLYSTIGGLHDELFAELAEKLNKYHGTNYSQRYWAQIISHWLMRSIEDLVKVFTEVSLTIEKHDITHVRIMESRIKDQTPINSHDYALLRTSEKFIVMLRSEVIRDMASKGTKICVIEKNIGNEINETILSNGNTFKKITNLCLSKFVRKFSCFGNIFISTSYLPIWSEIVLKLSILQNPLIRIAGKIQTDSKTSDFRNQLFDDINYDQPLKKFVACQLKWLLPRSYLEDYKSLKVLINDLGWPENPKVIFTANSFDTDDEFKIWSAEKISNGSTYVVMQHGNNFGTYRYPINPEIHLADYFFTWGWTNYEKEVPLFCQTIRPKNRYLNKKRVTLLVLRRQIPMRENLSDHPNLLNDLYREENNVLRLLKPEILSSAKFKNHPASKYKQDTLLDKYLLFDQDKKFIQDSIPAKKLYKSSKLVFFECYSTGVLECLSLDIPTIFLWPEGLDSLLNESVDDFKALIDSRVIFFSGSEAALHINNIWSNVEDWWNDPTVQNARRMFVSKHARNVDSPIRNLRKILKSIENSCP